MKKVIGMLAVLAFGSSMASAELLKNFKYDGKLEVNASDTSNRDDHATAHNDKTSDIHTRLQLNMGFDMAKDVDAVISIVKNDRSYGEGSQSADDISNEIYVEQAYVNLSNVLGFDHKVGRQYYGEAGDLVIYFGPTDFPYYDYSRAFGDNGPAMPVTAIDAYTGWYTNGKWDVHGLVGKTYNDVDYPDRDVDVTGVVVNYAISKDWTLGGYYYDSKWTVGESDHSTSVMGVKAKGNLGGLMVNGELAKNGGTSFGDKNTGQAIKLNAAYGFNLFGKLNLTGEYYNGSANNVSGENHGFKGINTDYRPGILFGTSGLAEGYVWSFLQFTDYNVGANWNPSKVKQLTVGAKYYHFSPSYSADYYYGNEFDFTADWKHSDAISLKAYLAYFRYCADSPFAGSVNDAVRMLGMAATVKF